MGEPNGAPQSSPEIQELYFDLIARGREGQRRGRRRRPDDDPVGLLRRRPVAPADRQRLDRGGARGRAPSADLTLETSWADWIAVSMRGEDPRRLMLRRRIRPRGSLRNLLRLGKVFPPRPTRLS